MAEKAVTGKAAARKGYITRAVVRKKCRNCLNGNRYDCEVGETGDCGCSLYPYQPWLGIKMPQRESGKLARA